MQNFQLKQIIITEYFSLYLISKSRKEISPWNTEFYLARSNLEHDTLAIDVQHIIITMRTFIESKYAHLFWEKLRGGFNLICFIYNIRDAYMMRKL